MRKTIFTKILSLIIIVGMLFSIAPITARAENLPQAEVTLSGVVKDGGVFEGPKHGYPLYAKITVTGPDGEQIVYSDPFTGAYEVMIETEVEYTIKVEAQLSGYIPYLETFTVTEATVKNIDLNVAASCTAPGYQPQYDVFFNFEGSEQGFTFGGQNSSWAWGEFTSGPGYAISGTHGIATNPAGQYNNSELSWAKSPVIDLSGLSADTVVFIEWWNWLYTESATFTWDVASVEFTANGTTWTTVWGPYPRQDTAYKQERVIVDSIYHVDTFQFRFWFESDSRGLRDGWYIDDIGIAAVVMSEPPIQVSAYYFDDDPAEEEWTTGSTGTGENSWAKGVPTTGPGAAYSDPNVWATNLDGNYNTYEVSYITSPVIDLSAYAGKGVVVEWMDWLRTESATYNWDVGRLYASNDGGVTFKLIEDNIKRQDTVGGSYKAQRRELPPDYTTSGFQFRFEFKSDYSGVREGWYIDNVEFSVEDAIALPCGTAPGGIVAGWVYDLNVEDADVPVLGALVATDAASDTTIERPYDADNDGLYYFFQPTEGAVAEDVEFTVSKDKYGTVVESRSITPEIVNHQDFRIGSGWIVANPEALERSIFLGDDDEYSFLTLENKGAAYGSFQIVEVDYGYIPLYQPVPAPKVSIPAFTGELNKDPNEITITTRDLTTPISEFTSPKLSLATSPIELLGGSLAYGNEVRSTDTLYRIPDLEIPGVWEPVSGISTTFYAGDFLGSDFSKIYAVSDSGVLYTIDTETGALTQIGPVGYSSVQGISGANGFFYGSTSNCSSSTTIFKMTPDAEVEVVANTSIACGIDLAYVPETGLIYIVDLISDSLYSVDPTNGTTSVVGALGFNPNYAQGMDYDEDNGILYWAAYGGGGDGQLRIIDIETGASVLVGPFSGDNETAFIAIAAGGTGGGGAIPWLDETPLEGTLQPKESAQIQLTWSVKDIDQPGDYFGELRVKTDTPIEVPPIPVTLHVWRPYNFGNIKGTVSAMEKCDINPAPAEEVTVNFYRDGELHKSTVTGEDGYYSYSLQAGTYDVEFVLDDYVTGRVDGVVLGNSEDVVVDMTLRHDSACLTYSPESFYQELYPNQMAEQTLTFTNTGAQDAIFEISEIVGESAVPYGYAQPVASKEVVELIVDDGSVDDAIGIGGAHPFIYVNRFTPTAEQYPFTLNRVDAYWWPDGGVAAGQAFRIIIYKNTSGNDNPAIGGEFVYQQDIIANDINAWESYELDEPITFEGPGDVIIGLAALHLPGSSYWPAAIDTTASKARSWVGWYSGNVPTPPTLPPDEAWDKIDTLGFPGNWMIRGYGETGGGTPGDIPWLSEDPTAGVVFADGGSVDVTLTFDATDLVWGDYFGALSIANAPDPKFTIPVQLRILPFNMMYLPMIQIFFAPPLHQDWIFHS